MEYLVHIATFACIWTMLGISLNLLVGETGLVSVTHAAFFGIGAYATAILTTSVGLDFFIAALAGIVLAGVIAGLSGVVLSRLREVYYVLGTVGFNFIVFSIFINWQSLTGGPLGIANIARPEFLGTKFSDSGTFLLFSFVCVLLVYGIASYITGSSFGRVLHSIREDESATAVFGYATHHYKLAIFTIAAMCAALGGSVYASYLTYIDPSGFTVNESIFILSIIILGGLGSARGAIVGACLLVALPEALRFVGFPTDVAAQMRQVVYGLILILLMLYRPQGLLGRFRI